MSQIATADSLECIQADTLLNTSMESMEPGAADMTDTSRTLPASTKRGAAIDDESRKRGRRMMGMLMGTLSKFKNETDPVAERQREIQARLGERLAEEKALLAATLQREREERMQKAAESRKKWEEASRAELEELGRTRRLQLAGFLKTSPESGSCLCFLPAVLTGGQEASLRSQRDRVMQEDAS